MRSFVFIFFAGYALLACTSPENQSSEQPDSKNDTIKHEGNAEESDEDIEGTPWFQLQDLFKSENSDVVNTIAMGNFDLAVQKANQYLNDPKLQLTATQQANLRYMHIFAMAGLVADGKRTNNDLEMVMNQYKDLHLITQHLPITKGNAMPFNQIQIEKMKRTSLDVTVTDNEGLTIHSFLRIELNNPFELNEHIGERAYISGILSATELSSPDILSWISGLTLKDAEIHILENDFE